MKKQEFGPKLVLRKAVVREIAKLPEARVIGCPDDSCTMASFVADKS